MNNKITFPELVDKIAELTNTSKRVSELFLKELFGVIKERLEQGESVKIKNLGTFKVSEIASRKSVNVNTGEEMEIPSHRRVSFTPDKSLAEAINTPFEGFETIVLDDDINEEELRDSEELGIRSEEPCGSEELGIKSEEPCDSEELGIRNEELIGSEELGIRNEEPCDSEELGVRNEESCDSEELGVKNEEPCGSEELGIRSEELSGSEELPPVFVEPQEAEPEVPVITETPKTEENEDIMQDECSDSDDDDYEEDVKTEKRKSFIWGFLGGIVTFIVIGCIAVAVCDSCFGDFVPYSEKSESVKEKPIATIAVDTVAVLTDSVESKTEIAVIEEPEIVTDTVRVNYYLTKMSRKYYGRYEFWVYIYEENKDKIKNPNKVSPGLVVVIPPASKYGIDKNNPESVDKAKKLAEKMQ